MRLWALTVSALFALSGCGAGARSVLAPPASVAGASALVTARISITIPPRVPSKYLRTPAFVSPNTLSIILNVNGLAQPVINVSSGQSSYTASVGVTPGSNSFVVKLFDAPNGSGKLLGQGSTSANVTATNPNVPVTIAGVIANLFIVAAPTSTTTVTLSPQAIDPDGAVINGPYLTPITLTNGSPTHTTLTPTSLPSSTSQATVVWDGIGLSPGCQADTVTVNVPPNIFYGQPIPLGGTLVSATTSASIQAAINAASTGGTLLITAPSLPAVIPITATLNVNKTLNICGISGAPPQIAFDGGHTTAIMQTASPAVNVSLYNFVFQNGQATSGGALTNSLSVTTFVQGSVFSGNTASSSGGAINNVAGATFTCVSCNISNNTATGGSGGGVFNAGTLTLTNSILQNNSAPIGGGVEHQGGAISIAKTRLLYNHATAGYGGGIDLAGGGGSINQSLLDHNTATAQGGGISITPGGSTNLQNSTVTANSSTGGTGGIDAGGNGIAINFATIFANQSSGSIGNLNSSISSTLNNSIVTGGIGPVTDLNGFWTGSNNYVQQSSSSPLSGTGNVFSAVIGLGPLTGNGGPTATLKLLSGPALAGVPSGCLSTDQRNMTRPGTGCDAGAYQTP